MVKIEEERKQRIEANKKKLEELNLLSLSSSLRTASALGPRTPPMKRKMKPRRIRSEMGPVRRSIRLTDKPAPDYKEVAVFDRAQLPRSGAVYPRRNLGNRVDASFESRVWATEQADKLEASLEGGHPSFVKPMSQSHVTGGFWLGLPSYFVKGHLPKQDGVVTLINEEGEEWQVIYLARKSGLSGGWKKFAVDHDLVDGDALVFQLVEPTTFKVFIIRESSFGAENTGEEE